MTRVVHGILRGRTIELAEDLEWAEGQEVEVQVRPMPTVGTRGEGLLRSAGALADDPEWDGIMAELARARKLERKPEAYEP
jgi:hypothetical protein